MKWYSRLTFACIAVLVISVLMSFFSQAARSLRTQPLRTATTRATPSTRKMHIQSIPMWEGSGNNYAYLVSDSGSKDSVIIDPANPPEVLPVLKEQISSGAINLKSIINTHHHHDHAGGNAETLKTYKLPIIGGKDCDQVTQTPAHNSTFSIGQNIKVRALHTPCHTQDSICYLFEDASTNERAVFTGDTLFIGGCGRFFEGTPKEMHKALNETLAALPEDTKVYPGHEYTKGNVKFGITVLQSDPVKKLQDFATNHKETQGKFTIGDEKKHNVFMRLDVSLLLVLTLTRILLTNCSGSDSAKGYRQNRPSRRDGCPETDEEQHIKYTCRLDGQNLLLVLHRLQLSMPALFCPYSSRQEQRGPNLVLLLCAQLAPRSLDRPDFYRTVDPSFKYSQLIFVERV